MTREQDLGRRGEDLAVRHPVERGYALVERDGPCREGEVALVMAHAVTTVLVEVTTRAGLGYGNPLEAVTRTTAARVRVLADLRCQAHPERLGPVRIDVVGVVWPRGGRPSVDVVRCAC
ncbi:YraN family protein [Clavibacter sp. VKM Ac-2872]|uniref:YraN family protein n=1 Tax=Clavibacter sp. VKM Ac-2872 TaxID=2783812 RepID=UPI00188A1D75|nr:YraN family protein [Clavibacter sp. VKM Ac-2872]MBF4623959.1 YraN family protein [Clavibacter sp. VKM Ac-2872]